MRISGSDNIKRCVDGVWAHDVVREYEDSVYSFVGDYDRDLTMEIVGDMLGRDERVLFRISFSSEESLRTGMMDNLYEDYLSCSGVCGCSELTDKEVEMSMWRGWWLLCLHARYYVGEHDMVIDAIRVFEN